MREIAQKINVDENAKGHPVALQGVHNRVKVRQIIDCWRYCGQWWSGHAPRDYYLIELETGQTLEIYCTKGTWTLARIAD